MILRAHAFASLLFKSNSKKSEVIVIVHYTNYSSALHSFTVQLIQLKICF